MVEVEICNVSFVMDKLSTEMGLLQTRPSALLQLSCVECNTETGAFLLAGWAAADVSLHDA